MGEWISPTSHGGTWYDLDPTKAYDGNTGTFAMMTRDYGAVLLYPPTFISCSKIRLWASNTIGSKADLKIEVYYGGGYHQIYDDNPNANEWVEISIGSTQTIENVRIYPQTIILSDNLYELEFWKEAEAPTYVVGNGTLKAGRIFQRM